MSLPTAKERRVADVARQKNLESEYVADRIAQDRAGRLDESPRHDEVCKVPKPPLPDFCGTPKVGCEKSGVKMHVQSMSARNSSMPPFEPTWGFERR